MYTKIVIDRQIERERDRDRERGRKRENVCQKRVWDSSLKLWSHLT